MILSVIEKKNRIIKSSRYAGLDDDFAKEQIQNLPVE